jgi:hypothetical protein
MPMRSFKKYRCIKILAFCIEQVLPRQFQLGSLIVILLRIPVPADKVIQHLDTRQEPTLLAT